MWTCPAARSVLIAVALTSTVLAHDLARSESRLDIRGAIVDCQLTVDLLEFPGVDADGSGTVTYAELDRSIADVFARVKDHFVVRGPDDAVRIVLTRHEIVDQHIARLALAYTFPAGVSRLEVTSTFDQLAGRPDHQHYVTAHIGSGDQTAVLDAAHRTIAFQNRWWTNTPVWLTGIALLIVGLRVLVFVGRRRS